MTSKRRVKLQFALELRKRATAAQQKAWELLRDRRLLGLKFRRQRPIRGFIVDFYWAELRLVLEIDGGIHDRPEQAAYDAARTAILERTGLPVVRFRNDAVSGDSLLSLLSPSA